MPLGPVSHRPASGQARRRTLLAASFTALASLVVATGMATTGGPTSAGAATAPADTSHDVPARRVWHSSDQRPGGVARPVSRAQLAATTRISNEVSWTVAPGLEFRRWDQSDARGKIRAYLLTAALDTPGLVLDYASGTVVRHRAPLTTLLARDEAVAGVNGDFFDIDDTGAPLGVGRDRQIGMRNAPAYGWNSAFWINADGTPAIGTLPMTATVAGRPRLHITNVNSPRVKPDGIGVYTSGWGRTTGYRVTDGQRRQVRQVIVRRGIVRSNTRRPSRRTAIRGQVLIGRGAGAAGLRRLRPGTPAKLTYGLEGAPSVAISGSLVLLDEGTVKARDDVALHPRTAIGVDHDSGHVMMLVIDGRQSFSRGYTLVELARMMRTLGAEDALNLDGGGSSTLVAARASGVVGVRNSPSDGGQRPVPNGLGITYTAPVG